MNVGSYDMESTPVAVALDDAMSAPFFGERRLVFINHPYFLTGENKKVKVDHDLDSLQTYFEHPEPSTILVLMAPYEKLDARKKLVKTLKNRRPPLKSIRFRNARPRPTFKPRWMLSKFPLMRMLCRSYRTGRMVSSD